MKHQSAKTSMSRPVLASRKASKINNQKATYYTSKTLAEQASMGDRNSTKKKLKFSTVEDTITEYDLPRMEIRDQSSGRKSVKSILKSDHPSRNEYDAEYRPDRPLDSKRSSTSHGKVFYCYHFVTFEV